MIVDRGGARFSVPAWASAHARSVRPLRSWIAAGLFAAALAAVAYQYAEPGAPAGTHWCPALTAVDFIPNHIGTMALRRGLPLYDNLRHLGGDFVDPIPNHEGILSRTGYPPPVYYLLLPVSGLARGLAWKLWLAGAVGALTLVMVVLASPGGGAAWLAPALAGALLAFYPVWFVLINGNIAVACLLPLAAGIALLAAGRSETLAALSVALAAAVKLYPALLVLHFASRGRWRLAMKTAAFGAAMAALTGWGGAWWTALDRMRRYDLFPQAWYPNASLFSVLMMGGAGFGVSYWAAKVFAALVAGLALAWTRRGPETGLPAMYRYGLLSLAMILAPNTNYDYNLVFAAPAMAAALWDLGRRPAAGRGPLLLMALCYAIISIPTHWLVTLPVWHGLRPQTAGMVVNKFWWLLLWYAATAWRYRQLESCGTH